MKVATILTLLVATISAEDSPLCYSIYLIRNLADQQHGIFDCWLYRVPEVPSGDPTFEGLIASRKLASIPKRLLSFKTNLIVRQPQLLLVFVEGNFDEFLVKLHNFVLETDLYSSLKIIVFHQIPSRVLRYLNQINQIFTTVSLFNVIYIRTDHFEVYHLQIYKGLCKSFNMKDPFIDQTADLGGHSMKISVTFPTIDSAISTTDGNGRLIEWICNTLAHLNGTCDLYQIKCVAQNLDDCDEQRRRYNATQLYDVTLDTISLGDYFSSFLYSAIPNQIIVVAPRGLRLTVYEVFALPFRFELWIALIAFIVVCYLLTWIRPNLFQNDLILMPVCGFETQDINQASLLEKITLISLITVTFALHSAYEAKLITFMTSIPYAASPRTFEDLLRLEITIPVHSRDSFGLGNDSRFNQVFKYTPATSEILNASQRNIGHLGTSQNLRMAIKNPDHFDVHLKRSKFVILDQFTMGVIVPAYFVGHRNFLRTRYHRSEVAFLEAGLMDYWTRRYKDRFFGVNYVGYVGTAGGVEGSTLGIAELGPVCVVLIIGCSISLVVFAFEVVFYKIKSKSCFDVKPLK